MPPKKWTKEETEFLLQNMDKMTYAEIALALGRTKNAISLRGGEIKRTALWTDEKINYLIEHGNNTPVKKIAEDLSMSYPTVYKKIRELGLNYNDTGTEFWSDEDIEYLIRNFEIKPFNVIARHLKRTTSSVQQKAASMNLKRSRSSRYWTDEELVKLKDLVQEGKDFYEIGAELDRSFSSVERKCQALGLLKIMEERRAKAYKAKELFILENCDKMTDLQIANRVDLSENQVADIRKSNGVFKHGGLQGFTSDIQRKIESILEETGFSFNYNEKFGDYFPDFINHENKVIIEVNGDYWHCNPTIYNQPKDSKQVKHIVTDYGKKCYYFSKGYMLITIWENDIVNHLEEMTNHLNKLLTAVFDGNIDYDERAKSVESYNWVYQSDNTEVTTESKDSVAP